MTRDSHGREIGTRDANAVYFSEGKYEYKNVHRGYNLPKQWEAQVEVEQVEVENELEEGKRKRTHPQKIIKIAVPHKAE